MQGQRNELERFSLEPFDQVRREVQPGRRCRDGAFPGGEHRLIIRNIIHISFTRPLDIGRQRRAAVFFQRRPKLLGSNVETQAYFRAIPGKHLGREIAPKCDDIAGLEAPGILGEGQPFACPFVLVQGYANLGVAPAAIQLCGDHPCVIDDKQAARFKKLWQIADEPILKPAPQIKQTRRIPRISRTLRDQLTREVKIKVSGFHFRSRNSLSVD